MPSSSRCGSLVLVIAGALAAQGCSSTGPAPQSCQTAAECSATARCISSTCVANAAPIASVLLPAGALEANLLLSFDGSGSTDPDSAAGDSIVSHAWAFRAIAAACAPPVVAGTGPAADVRFACPGRYAVDLTVTDELEATGVATEELDVGDYSGPALLEIGPDVPLEHACSTGPVRCAPVGTVALSASPTAAAPADVALLWTVEPPPGRDLGANRRVIFDPGPNTPSPTVTIETDGQAISGDWIFHVEARDAAGVVASGAVRVSVGNRRPVVTRTIPIADHTFDGTQFTATGEVPFTVTDPDGDDLVDRTVQWHHAGDGTGGMFTGTILEGPGRVTFSIVVPYAAPGDALRLIGGAGLERSIVFSITDVNGAPVVEVWPIIVGNRPPVLLSEATGLAVEHTYDTTALAYRAFAPLSTWSDPDGDPLRQVPGSSTGDPQCPQLDVVGGISTASCSLAFTGTPAVPNFAGAHRVAQQVQDPWVAATSTSTVSFSILNRAPTIDTSPVPLHTACFSGDCCRTQRDLETGIYECVAWDESWDSASTTVSGRWNDADGDPLTVTVSGAPSQVCTPSTCAMAFIFGGHNQCGNLTTPQAVYATTAEDGAASVSTNVTVNVMCP